MKLQFLKYFCVLAEELHFRRAASRLAISQPPLSAAIKSLEDELGAQLFVRTSKLVQLTAAGAAFLIEAQQILDRLSRVGGVVRAVDGGLHGRLDVGLAASLMYREVPDILARFRREMPAVELALHELSTSEQIEKLSSRQLHIAFVHGSTLPPQLKNLALGMDTFVLCLPDRHPLAGRASIDLREMADESFVMFSRATAPANHDNVIAIFSRAGIHPRTVHHARGWLTIVALVAQAGGVALVPKSLVRAGMSGVRFVPLKGTIAALAPAMLAWNPGMTVPAMTKFIEIAEQTVNRKGRPRLMAASGLPTAARRRESPQ